MEITYIANLKSFHRVNQWRRMFAGTSSPDEFDRTVIAICKDYGTELRYRLGLITPYNDDLQRIVRNRMTLRSIDSVFDQIAEYADGKRLPEPVQSLFEFLRDASLDMAAAIRYLESLHPEIADIFAEDRTAYRKMKHEAEHLA